MLTSASLQLIAIITMLIDHLGLYLFGNPAWMRAIGRFAMPLFCFMLAEGFLHTKGKRDRYFGRLLIFAFISQLPYDLVHYVTTPVNLSVFALVSVKLNVMFTLAIGFAAMAMIERKTWTLVFLPIPMLLAEYLNTDYGAYGVAMIVGFYLASKFLAKKKYQIWRWLSYAAILFISTTIYVSEKRFFLQTFALLAIFPIILYNGKLGHRLPKWFGYIFYPAHLAAIALAVFLLPL